MIKKTAICILFVIMHFTNAYSQEATIVKILNHELQREIKIQFYNRNFNGDTLYIIHPFSIDQNKILSFQVKRINSQDGGYTLIQQQVHIRKIKNIGKDISVLFETAPDAVTTTTTTVSSSQETSKSISTGYYLRTFLSTERNNEYLAKEIVNAFKKAGYNITTDSWYD